MPNDDSPDAPLAPIELAGYHRVQIQRGDGVDTVELLGRDGKLVFAIEVSEGGPVLRFEGPGLTLRAAGELAVVAKDIALRAESRLSLEAGGDLSITAGGVLHSSAREQRIEAVLGDVALDASDDVTIDGERVLVNC